MSIADRSAAVGFAVGGVLWAAHGSLTMLKPGGEEVRFSETRGYSLVTDAALFVGYNAPGAAALLVTALATLVLDRGLLPRSPRTRAAGTVAVTLAAALGLISAVGVAILFDPVFTAARVVGSLLLGAGAVLLAVGTRSEGSPSAAWLAAVGVLSLGLLPLWPLVYAVKVVPEWGGAAYFGVIGVVCLLGAARLLPATSTR